MLFVALTGVLSAINTNWAAALQDGFEDGNTQKALESNFDEAVVIRQASIETWNALRYALFGEALPGAIVGRDGWLFTAEEYEQPADFEEALSQSLDEIGHYDQLLEQMSIELVVVLLPDKARIEGAHVKLRRGAMVETRYRNAVSGLRQRDIDVVDLREAMSTAEGQVFMRTDTHWTPFGADVAAARIAAFHEFPGDGFETRTDLTGHHVYEGDLFRYLDTGIFSGLLGLSYEEVADYVTSGVAGGEEGATDLFSDTAPPGALVGTSYSAIRQWNFLGFLKEHTQRDILNFSEEGRGPFKPMRAFVAKHLPEMDASPEFVIWEIPERYLTIEQDENG